MNSKQQIVARECFEGAEGNTITFPEIIEKLGGAGLESYAVDFRRATTTYFAADNTSIEFSNHSSPPDISARLDNAALAEAIGEAQRLVPGYTYKGFCLKAKAAGCAGYLVTLSGRRAVYFGRDGAVHTEHFPQPL